VKKGQCYGIRLHRFLLPCRRDFLFRNATVSRTLELWDGVVENEEKNIIPNGKKADYIINSFLPYELNIIKNYLFQAVKYNDSIGKEGDLLQMIKQKFENIPEISSHFVPQNSVFREFIGKEIYN
jgi:uridine kinase